MERVWVTIIVCALMALAQPASAQQDAPGEALTPERVEGRRMLAEAEALYEQGDYARASQRFLDLYEHMQRHAFPRAPRALWSAGESLAHVPGRESEARETLQRFLNESNRPDLTADSTFRDQRSRALELIAEMEARGAGTEGQPRGGSLGSPTPPGGSTPSPVGPVLVGTGGAVLLASAVVGTISLVQDADFRSACADRTACPSALRPQYEEMRTFSGVADALFVGGVVVAALGVVLSLTVHDGHPPATITASCGSTGCSASLHGVF